MSTRPGIQVAVNYSSQAKSLVEEQRIRPNLFKCPAWAELVSQVKARHPVYVHFGLNTCDNTIREADWDAVERLLDETVTRYVNVHLQARAEDFPGVAPDSQTPEDRQKVVARLVHDVSLLTQRFGPERVIAENVIYRGAGDRFLYLAVDPEVISDVVRQTGCGLLLDTAHARMTCSTRPQASRGT